MRNPFTSRRSAGDSRTDATSGAEDRIRRIAAKRAAAVVQPVERRVERTETNLAVVRVDLERIGHELRAIEYRLSTGADPTAALVDPAAPGADVLAEIRREHEQIRARFQVISRYDERLRRLENAVVKLYDGDLLDPGAESRGSTGSAGPAAS